MEKEDKKTIEERQEEVKAAEVDIENQEKHQQKINELNTAGIPYINRTVYQMDKFNRPVRFYNPKTKKSSPAILLKIYTQVEILKIKLPIAIVRVPNGSSRGRFIVPLGGITQPRVIEVPGKPLKPEGETK